MCDDLHEWRMEKTFGKNPFEGWTEEEIEEFFRLLNEDFDDDWQWSGRF